MARREPSLFTRLIVLISLVLMAGAAALSLMAVMLAKANRRHLSGFYPVALALAVAPLPFTAWQRLAAGRHFLSDEVFSLLVIALIAAMLSGMLKPAKA